MSANLAVQGEARFGAPDCRERNQRIVEMYATGCYTLREIGELEGITYEWVRVVVRRAGVTPEQSRAAARAARVVVVPCHSCGKPVERPDRFRLWDHSFCTRQCQTASKKIPAVTLIERMRSLAVQLGRVPGKRDLDERGGPGCSVYQRRFGSLRAAQAAAGLEPRSPGHYADPKPWRPA